jgi:hypothetical protein
MRRTGRPCLINRGKPAVRNFRDGNGNVGIMRSPLRAIALPDQSSGFFHMGRVSFHNSMPLDVSSTFSEVWYCRASAVHYFSVMG